MKRVLVVTPNWPPLSFPDLHRVRMSLPYLAKHGWEPLILKIDPAEQPGTRDPDLEKTVPAGTRVWQAGCIPHRYTRWLGLNHVGLRSFLHIARLGDEIIRREKPALALFSTTMFPLFVLGRYWLRRHGVPYMLDYQDPWSAGATKHRRGAAWKDRSSRAMSAFLEPFALAKAAHVVCVSPAYPEALHRAYGFEIDRTSVIPFGGPEGDFELLSNMPDLEIAFHGGEAQAHWVYAGRCGPDMTFALRSLFIALRRAREEDPSRYAQVRLHFLGTDYASGDRARNWVAPIAEEVGVGAVASEKPARVPYFQALKSLQQADALIVPGSTDPGYTASKIYPYILSKRPLLAVFHEASSVVEVLRSTAAGTVITFGSRESCEQVAEKILKQWFRTSDSRSSTTDWKAFQRYTARAMTAELCGRMDAVAASNCAS